MEPIEVGEFREKMEEVGEKHDRVMMRVSLIISVLAAMTATVIVLGHREHTEAILTQASSGDQWQEYESHKMRITLKQMEITLLSDQPSSDSAKVQTDIKNDQVQIEKWTKQEEKEMESARELGDEKRVSEARANRFDLGEALLQIAVVLASITLLTRHHRYVVTGCVLGVIGAALTISAFLLH